MRFFRRFCLLIFTSSTSTRLNFILKKLKFNNYNSNSIFIPNFGYENYLSYTYLRRSNGNSSSGITEAPLRKMVITLAIDKG